MFDPETEMPERQKHFIGMFCAWGFLRFAREKEPDFMSHVAEEKQQEFIDVFKRYAVRLFDYHAWLKGFKTPDGMLDVVKMLPYRDYCPVVV